MKKIKIKIIKFVNRVLKHTEIYGIAENLRMKLDRTTTLLHLLTPDILPIEEKAMVIFKKVNTNELYANSDLTISKNDLMFLFWLHHTKTIEAALDGYFASGLLQANIIEKLLIEKFENTRQVKVLDFASGHGRVSRYFKNFLSNDQITISDIKINAVLFQQQTFHYHGFSSTCRSA